MNSKIKGLESAIDIAVKAQRIRKYTDLRMQIGSQTKVAKLLEVRRETLSRRESGDSTISKEAMLAMEHLWVYDRGK
jgi:DNA-binding XRE family transcriptional regulator